MATLLPDWAARRPLILRGPGRPDIWPYHGREAQQALLQLIARIHQPMAARGITIQLEIPANALDTIRSRLPAGVEPVVSPYADIWIRDCAPFYFSSTESAKRPPALCTDFNGWAGLDPDYAGDIQARAHLCQRFQLTYESLDLVLEGGSVQTNGAGVIAYVASAVLDPARNPGLTKAAFEAVLRERFGAASIIAIEHGVSCDETGGHVDNLLSFLSPELVMVSAPDDPEHADYALGVQVTAQLAQHFARLNKPLSIVRTPLPALHLSAAQAASIEPRQKVKQRPAGMPLTASYTNGIRIDDIYMLPQFGVAEDAVVMQLLQRQCPQLEIIPVPGKALLAGGGGWHCASHAVA
ncbi:MAG: agmatine deiminase family protein [Idiomarina sp.]|nr:agmatine deiminase family protein [Idiomarina sp.]